MGTDRRHVRAWIPALTAMLLVGLAPPATAHDHKPPATRLVVGTRIQKGRLGSYCWTHASGPYVVGSCADTTWSFPRALRARPGREVAIEIDKATAPDELYLRSWRRLDRDGEPVGRGRRVGFELRPRFESADSQPTWEVLFSVPRRRGHYYLEAFGYWTDVEGTFERQDASYTFHVLVV